MSLLTGCKCIGIDINKDSIKEAKRYAKANGVDKKVRFLIANARNLPFKDESFDYVWCSNVTSFIKNKERAISEYLRVLKPNGTLIVIPIYYIKTPPKNIVDKVSEAIGSEIKIWNKSFWLDLFEKLSYEKHLPLQLYYFKDFCYLDRKKYIKGYIEQMMKKEHIREFNLRTKTLIKKRLYHFMSLFNKNLKYAGYSILLYQKRFENEETELFLTGEYESD